MDTDAAIRTFLLSKKPITDIISNRIYDSEAGRGDKDESYMIFEQEGGAPNFSNLGGQSSYKNKNYVFTCVADKIKKTATNLREAVRDACESLKADGATEIDITENVAVHNVIYIDEFWDDEVAIDESGAIKYSAVIEYSFSFRSTA